MKRTHLSRRRLGALAVLAVSAAISACAPPPPPNPNLSTVTNAAFEWTVSREADHGTFAPGEVNYWSAGQSDSTAATYVPSNANATVLKMNAAGTYVPIGSGSAVTWANRNRSGNGAVVTAFSSNYLGQKVRFTGGVGTLDPTTGVSTIQWSGTFTINFYGRYVPFWITNPRLVVNSSGVGQITATMAGFASTLDNPDVRTPLAPQNVVIADLPAVAGANTSGFTAATAYLNTTVTPPTGAGAQVAKTAANSAFWGSWPQSFVNFQGATGLGSFWYTSGSSKDVKKPQEPVVISYGPLS